MRRLAWGLLLGLAAGASAAVVTPVLVQLPQASSGELLGVWDGQRWLALPTAASRIKGAQNYQLLGLTGPLSTVNGTAPESDGEPCPDARSLELSPSRVSDESRLALGKALVPRPRAVTLLSPQSAVYREVVRRELQKRGLLHPTITIQKVVRADLDGDGTAEVLIEASHFEGESGPRPMPSPDGAAGNYSLLLLRFLSGQQVKTAVLGEYTLLKASSDINAPKLDVRFSLEGLADFNGDGRFEIVTSAAYYEGIGLALLTWTPRQGLKTVLETACGA